MFAAKIDWKDPRFAKWNLSNLGELNQAQLDSFLDDDENQDIPEFNEADEKEFCLKIPCQVQLFHSNVCYGVEKSWPKILFNRDKLSDLSDSQKKYLYRKMTKDGVKLYNKYVSMDRLKKRQQNGLNRALAPYREERRLRNLFNRIKALATSEVPERQMSTDSETSLLTVIDTQQNKSNVDGPVDSASDHGEILTDSRIVYDCSSEGEDADRKDEEDIYLSANEDEMTQSQESAESNTTSPFETPSKNTNDIEVMSTPNIHHLRQIRRNLFEMNSNVSVTLETYDSIGMVIEVETELSHPVESNHPVELIGKGPSSDDRNIRIIDNRYNDITSDNSVTSSTQKGGDDDESESVQSDFSIKEINDSEFVVINSNRLNEDVDKTLNTTELNRYQLRNRRHTTIERLTKTSHKVSRLNQSFNDALYSRSKLSPNRYQLRKRN